MLLPVERNEALLMHTIAFVIITIAAAVSWALQPFSVFLLWIAVALSGFATGLAIGRMQTHDLRMTYRRLCDEKRGSMAPYHRRAAAWPPDATWASDPDREPKRAEHQ